MTMTRRLVHLPIELAQQILDELALRINAGRIRSTPLAYLAGLISRAEVGTFVPTAGGAARQEAKTESHSQTRHSDVTGEVDPMPAPVYLDVATNPLCQRIVETHMKAKQRSAPPPEEECPAIVPHSALKEPPITTVSKNGPSRPRPIFAHLARVIGNRDK